jgi:hypothetical protein
MNSFHCEDCNITFEDHQGLKKEYRDHIYGPCWKYIAYCPQCKQESSQKRVPNPGKAKTDFSMECGSGGCKGSGCSMY